MSDHAAAPARRRLLAAVAVSAAALTVSAAVAVGPGGTAAGAASARPSSATKASAYAIDRPLCHAPASPTEFRCYAVERQPAAAGTPGAYRVSGKYGSGPAHGYTPAELAKAYGYNPAAKVNQTVAVVDWYDDPNVRADLNAFDRTYHLPVETATSFRKVNQNGLAKPLPRSSRASATEIALDVQAVRAVCQHCRILLVEAAGPTANDIAAAENTAVRLGATEISNSFGGLESGATSRMLAAFHQPGVVITASTGDDGWLGWDYANAGYWADAEASYPAADPGVVSVGGTTLLLNPDGTRSTETVWNDDGVDDAAGAAKNTPMGASGGGCSQRFAAGSWQWHVAGYAALHCGRDGRHRMTADVSVVADPATGFDVRDTFGHSGWLTVGGTSLSSPLVAAMYALAGGSGGSAYPAASLYVNRARHPASAFDVVAGGNGYCGGETDLNNCMAAVSLRTNTAGNNPNGITGEPLDCSFASDGLSVTSAPQLNPQCNATPGYDGPTGVGTPIGLGLFHPTSAVGRLTGARRLAPKRTGTWRAALHPRIAGATFTHFTWSWGDGKHSATTRAAAQHAFRRPGRYTVRVTAYDSLHQIVVRKATVRVTR